MNPTREQRLTFGEVAETYHRARPGYPDALFAELVTIAALQPGDPVLEVGAGTGKATVGLASHRLSVTALEPSAEMATVARREVPAATIIESAFEEWPLEPNAFAAVVAAQSWHWVRDDIGPPKAADALRPAGWLVLLWNQPDLDECAWHDDLQPIYREITPGMEHAANRRIAGSIQDAVAKIDRSRRFGRCVTRRFPFTETYTSAAYVELLETHSDKRMLPPEQRAALCAAIGASLDRAGGQVVHPYVAEMVAAPVVK